MSVAIKYKELKLITKREGLNSQHVTEAIIKLVRSSLESLLVYPKLNIRSAIVGKEYFVFKNGDRLSRPINKELFSEESLDFIGIFRDKTWESILDSQLQKLLYTMAMSYCAAVDVISRANKKSPSIFFEVFIGNMFAREYLVNPITQISINLPEIQTNLPTDYLFQPTGQFVKIHLPIKLSTRERSVQAWAHQRVLEGMRGVGTYRGVMVVLTETNFVSKDLSVVEVCLPEQWRIYQMYISRMTRIYYFDLPLKYAELPDRFPHIQVKHFASFFREKDTLIRPDLV